MDKFTIFRYGKPLVNVIYCMYIRLVLSVCMYWMLPFPVGTAEPNRLKYYEVTPAGTQIKLLASQKQTKKKPKKKWKKCTKFFFKSAKQFTLCSKSKYL